MLPWFMVISATINLNVFDFAKFHCNRQFFCRQKQIEFNMQNLFCMVLDWKANKYNYSLIYINDYI